MKNHLLVMIRIEEKVVNNERCAYIMSPSRNWMSQFGFIITYENVLFLLAGESSKDS